MRDDVLVIERLFGDKDVPMLKRDFRIVGIKNSPFGTIPEYVKLIKDKELSYRTILCCDDIMGTETWVKIDEEFNFSVLNHMPIGV